MRHLCLVCALLSLTALAHTQAPDLEQHLRDQYQGKTFALRGFYSGDHLHYDSSGAVIGNDKSDDWTASGFVQVDKIRVSHQELKITAKRLTVFYVDSMFRLRPDESADKSKNKKPLFVEIDADLDRIIPRVNKSMPPGQESSSLRGTISQAWFPTTGNPAFLQASLANTTTVTSPPKSLRYPG